MFNPIQRVPVDSFRFKTAAKHCSNTTHQLQQNENLGKPYETKRIWGYQTNVSKKNHPNQSFLIDVSFGFVSSGFLRHDIVFQVLNQILLNMFVFFYYVS